MLEFSHPENTSASTQLLNGLWSFILAVGMLYTAAASRSARQWRFFHRSVRALIEDYGAPLMVIVWTGVSYALSGSPVADGVPTRVNAPDTQDALAGTSAVAGGMADVPGQYIAAALVPALIIVVLFYFDHRYGGFTSFPLLSLSFSLQGGSPPVF